LIAAQANADPCRNRRGDDCCDDAAKVFEKVVKTLAAIRSLLPHSQFPNRQGGVPQPCGESKREVYCVNRKATASIAIKPAINNNEIVAAILFALGLSFHDRRP
jgi:hypothetical protein